ncbi:hypothetical protein LVB87_15270 [Lysobacter sp. KIS68-7]|uniref:hypothetical protein n=1 Tax=Lysobacter sp. KIS68-7 TaxID=2904252 RepID=UPI001E2FB8AD|nr:hypothetical protein [Lysobacter sp. KIS68-7]UHQ19527.1 hypothetical protein LVB87_15270 [Lysobacter sp. KIS68-7]
MIKVRRLRRLLRTSLLALLVLGLLVRPVLLSIGDGHEAEASLVASTDGHVVHDHIDHDDNGKPCPDQAQGDHGARSTGGGTVFATVAPLAVAILQLPPVALPPPDVTKVVAHVSASPFRPPIA